MKGNLERTLLTEDLGTLIRLEGCLSGNIPAKSIVQKGKLLAAGLDRMPHVCTDIAKAKARRWCSGPARSPTRRSSGSTRVSEQATAQESAKANQVADAARRTAAAKGYSKAKQNQLAAGARKLVAAQFIDQAMQLALRYGLTSAPAINNTEFVSQLWFDPSKGVGVPKARFAFLAPSPNAALVQVRLKPGLSDQQRRHAIGLIQKATSDKFFRMRNGQQYIVSGVPVVADALASSVQHAVVVLLIAALIVMAATLALVFKARLRMLPLALALAAAALAFGVVALVGGSLTMASVAALPVLIGLAVDYAIQFHARFEEGRAAGLGVARRRTDRRGCRRADDRQRRHRDGRGLPRAAAVARADGARLRRGAGAGHRVRLRLRAHGRVRGAVALRRPSRARVCASARRTCRRSSRARVGGSRASPPRSLGTAVERPRRVLAVGLLLAALGWAADTQTRVISDVTQLVPQNLQALKDVHQLEDATGVSGELDVTVHAKDLTDPSVVRWMTGFEQSVLAAHGYKAGDTCHQAKDAPELCPALSLPDLFATTGQTITQQSIRSLLSAVPAYFSQGVISHDRTRGEHGVRHPPDAARQAEEADRRHPRKLAPAARRDRQRGGAAGAGGRGQQRAVVHRPPRALAAGGARGRVPRAAGHPPPPARRGGAADPDRVRHRLVGARAVPPAHSAQPDVRRARRARDRDLHRVQRAAVRALSARSAARAPVRRARWSAPTPPPARPCSPPAPRRSPASPR